MAKPKKGVIPPQFRKNAKKKSSTKGSKKSVPPFLRRKMAKRKKR